MWNRSTPASAMYDAAERRSRARGTRRTGARDACRRLLRPRRDRARSAHREHIRATVVALLPGDEGMNGGHERYAIRVGVLRDVGRNRPPAALDVHIGPPHTRHFPAALRRQQHHQECIAQVARDNRRPCESLGSAGFVSVAQSSRNSSRARTRSRPRSCVGLRMRSAGLASIQSVWAITGAEVAFLSTSSRMSRRERSFTRRCRHAGKTSLWNMRRCSAQLLRRCVADAYNGNRLQRWSACFSPAGSTPMTMRPRCSMARRRASAKPRSGYRRG